MIAGVGEGEVALRQAIGRIVDADPARRRDGLDARGEMKGRADGERLETLFCRLTVLKTTRPVAIPMRT